MELLRELVERLDDVQLKITGRFFDARHSPPVCFGLQFTVEAIEKRFNTHGG